MAMRLIHIGREHRALLCAILLAAGMAAGCRAKSVPGSPETPMQLREKVIAKNFALYQYMRVVHHKAVRTEADLLQVKLGLENQDDDGLWCDIQVVFYDADQFELEKTNWQPLFLSPEQITYYTTMSLSPKACDYTVFLRNPRESEAE